MALNGEYNDLSIWELFKRNYSNPSESKNILLHLSTRPEADRAEFLTHESNLRATLAVNYQHEKIIKGSETAKIEQLKATRVSGYYAEYKVRLDKMLRDHKGDGTTSLMVLMIESLKQQVTFDQIKKEYLSSENQEDKDYYFYLLDDIKRSIKYAQVLDSRIRRAAIDAKEKREPKKPFIAAIALKYVYQQEAGTMEKFENLPKKKVGTTDEIAAQYGINATNFRLKYNFFSKSPSNRIKPENIPNIEAAAKLLKGDPEALKLAIDELNKAKQKM